MPKDIFISYSRRDQEFVTRLASDLYSLVKEVQTLDLRSGSYTDNFYKLVDGLIAAGAVRPASYEKPFLRQPTRPSMRVFLGKALG